MSERNFQTVYIEGMDLSGKTTAASSVQRELGVRVRRGVISTEGELAGQVTPDMLARAIASPEARDELRRIYTDVIQFGIANYRQPDHDVLQESTLFAKFYAVDKGLGTPPEKLREFEKLRDAHPSFDRAIYLTCSVDERLRRFEERQKLEAASANDLRLVNDRASFLRSEATMRELAIDAFSAIVLDTTDMSPREVRDEIISYF